MHEHEVEVIAFEAMELLKGPLESGRPSRGLKYCRIDIVEHETAVKHHTNLMWYKKWLAHVQDKVSV